MTDESTRVSLRDSDEELYGLLLLANQKVSNVGTMLVWVLGIVGLLICVAIHMRWVPTLLGIPVDELRGFGVYTLIMLLVFTLFYWVTSVQERQIYGRMRPELLARLRDQQMSVQVLLARIADDDDLEDIRDQLMDDASIWPTSRSGSTRS